MPIFKTKHQKKATVKTVLIMALLFVAFFLVGLTYLDPPPEMGIEINFGTSNDGRGQIQPLTTKTSKNIPQQAEQQQSQPQQEEVALAQDQDDTPVVAESKPKPKPKKEQPKQESKPKAEPKPDQSTSYALNNILGAPSTTNQSSSGHGDGKGNTDKGQIDGNPYANAFYGGGSGRGSGFGLNGRKKQSNQAYEPKCNETGRVVVQIEVDQSGKVIKATPGAKGTTNTAACLMEPAKKTALSYRFNADSKAPNTQIGFVVVDFRLGTP